MSEMLNKIIEAEIRNRHNWEDYAMFPAYWKYADFGTPRRLERNTIALVTGLNLIGTVAAVTDLSKGLLTLSSPNAIINYQSLVKVNANTDFVNLFSDFPSFHYSDMEISQVNDNLFNSIYAGAILYYVLKPKCK